MNRKPKATIRDTSRGWNGYEGRRKVMEFQNIDAAEAWLYDKQYPKQNYGEAVNPETGEVAPPLTLTERRDRTMTKTLPNPDAVGQSEYRALFDLLADAEAIDGSTGTIRNAVLAHAMIDEVEEWATTIRKAVNAQRPKRTGARSR